MSYRFSVFGNKRSILMCPVAICFWHFIVSRDVSQPLSCSYSECVWDLTLIRACYWIVVELVLGEGFLSPQSSLCCRSCELLVNMGKFPGSIPLLHVAPDPLLPVVPSRSVFTPSPEFLLSVLDQDTPARAVLQGHRT